MDEIALKPIPVAGIPPSSELTDAARCTEGERPIRCSSGDPTVRRR